MLREESEVVRFQKNKNTDEMTECMNARSGRATPTQAPAAAAAAQAGGVPTPPSSASKGAASKVDPKTLETWSNAQTVSFLQALGT